MQCSSCRQKGASVSGFVPQNGVMGVNFSNSVFATVFSVIARVLRNNRLGALQGMSSRQNLKYITVLQMKGLSMMKRVYNQMDLLVFCCAANGVMGMNNFPLCIEHVFAVLCATKKRFPNPCDDVLGKNGWKNIKETKRLPAAAGRIKR